MLAAANASESDVTNLVHVRSREEIRAAEEVTQLAFLARTSINSSLSSKRFNANWNPASGQPSNTKTTRTFKKETCLSSADRR